MTNNYISVSYSTYNFRNVFTASILLIMYFVFITDLCVAIKYEILNKRDECDVRYYYSRACRNKISNSILFDPAFLKRKRGYLKNVNENITPKLDTAMTFSDIQDSKISNNENVHNKKTTDAKTTITSQFKIMSDALYTTIVSFLGNSNASDSPGVNLKTLQDKIKESIPEEYISDTLQPTLTKMISPLQKLYQMYNQ